MMQRSLSQPTWSITILVILAAFVYVSGEASVSCSMPSVKIGQDATLTCDFGVDMQSETQRNDVAIERVTKATGKLDDILDCYWDDNSGPGYKCNVLDQRFTFSNEVTRYTSVQLDSVSKEDEGQYYCKIIGSGEVPGECSFTLKVQATTTPPIPKTTTPPPKDPCKGWKGATIFLIILCLGLSGAVGGLGYLYWRTKRKLSALKGHPVNQPPMTSNAVQPEETDILLHGDSLPATQTPANSSAGDVKDAEKGDPALLGGRNGKQCSQDAENEEPTTKDPEKGKLSMEMEGTVKGGMGTQPRV